MKKRVESCRCSHNNIIFNHKLLVFFLKNNYYKSDDLLTKQNTAEINKKLYSLLTSDIKQPEKKLMQKFLFLNIVSSHG